MTSWLPDNKASSFAAKEKEVEEEDLDKLLLNLLSDNVASVASHQIIGHEAEDDDNAIYTADERSSHQMLHVSRISTRTILIV